MLKHNDFAFLGLLRNKRNSLFVSEKLKIVLRGYNNNLFAFYFGTVVTEESQTMSDMKPGSVLDVGVPCDFGGVVVMDDCHL